MTTYKRATIGNKFCVTELGFEIGRVRTKFENSSQLKNQYERCVPSSWVDNGWVEEVKDETSNN